MRISRAEHVHSSANQATAIDQSLDWARMAKLTLLAMAASLLFLACRCQALTYHNRHKFTGRCCPDAQPVFE